MPLHSVKRGMLLNVLVPKSSAVLDTDSCDYELLHFNV